jgi:DNA-binding response OmpR family regulator
VAEPRILIIENDRTLRQALFQALLDVEIASDCASDAGEALELLLEQHYIVVILDVAIVGGAEAVISAVQRMRGSERSIIIATAETESVSGLDAEAVQVVMRRPVRVREVAELARACIDTRAARRRTSSDAGELRVF